MGVGGGGYVCRYVEWFIDSLRKVLHYYYTQRFNFNCFKNKFFYNKHIVFQIAFYVV